MGLARNDDKAASHAATGDAIRPRRGSTTRSHRYHPGMNAPRDEAIPTVHLKIERRSNHPWIFQKMVEKPDVKPKPGSVVAIVDRDGKRCGSGFYNGHSRIALRVLSEDPDEVIDERFF